jgi:tetratricopeptide (TPR) repeat protein
MVAKPIANIRAHLLGLATDLQAALAHHHAGRVNEAEALYRKMLEAAPNHPQALRLLGVIETERGHPARGVELIGKAFPALARFPQAHLDLGNALLRAGKLERAVESYREVIALKPDSPMAHVSLAGVLNKLGRFEAAITHCQAALAVQPEFLAARIVLAVALKGADRLPEAADAWREVITRQPDRAESYYHLASELAELGLYTEALHCHDRALALEPENVTFHCARGNVLMRLYHGDKAEAAYRRAISISPTSQSAWEGLGWALRLLGRYNEAEACAEQLRKMDPNDLRAVRHLPSTRQPQTGEAEIDRLRSVLDHSDASTEDGILAGFALGRLLDSAGRYDEAFSHYAAANTSMRQVWPRNGDGFDAKAFSRQVDRLIEFSMSKRLINAAMSGNISELPVFIVGMPRSGTTLVEQICASHSRIFGASELFDIPRIVRGLAREQGDEANKTEARRRAADAHILRLHGLSQGAVRIVDKLPDNILNVDLIIRLFPRARIIYCSRDFRDTSLSCYFQIFSEGAQYFSYDLADCLIRSREIQRLAEHWLKLLPLHMVEVNYETLVADLEGESRRIIEFLQLDWEAACLDFHQTERTVATVSHWQVRQPIYNSSVGRWRHYDKYFAPLLTDLNKPIHATRCA